MTSKHHNHQLHVSKLLLTHKGWSSTSLAPTPLCSLHQPAGTQVILLHQPGPGQPVSPALPWQQQRSCRWERKGIVETVVKLLAAGRQWCWLVPRPGKPLETFQEKKSHVFKYTMLSVLVCWGTKVCWGNALFLCASLCPCTRQLLKAGAGRGAQRPGSFG